jgi:two-component system, chemotaxis family, sensor kinase CheA
MMIEDEELRSLYKVSCADHTQTMEAGILRLEKNPQDTATLEEMLREAHTLKGDSRMLGVNDVETLIHQIEEILQTTKQGTQVLTADTCDALYQGIDAIRKIAHEAITGQPSGVKLFQVMAQLMGSATANTTVAPPITHPAVQSKVEETTEELEFRAFLDANSIPPPSEAEIIPLTAANPVDEPASTPSPEGFQVDTLRVEASKLDRLLTQAGELVVTKGRFSDRLNDMQSIQALWEDWNREALTSRRTFDELEQRLQTSALQPIQKFYTTVSQRLEQLGTLVTQLKNGTSDDTARLEIVTHDLEAGIRTLRLLPLSTIFSLFPRTVRDLAKVLGKEVNLVIEGGDTLTDKKILEEIQAPLTHLVRNAIDHGIELPGDREAQGKPRIATIRLRAYQTGSTVCIEVIDDGCGIDLESIKRTTLRRGLQTETELAAMSTAQLQALIFAPSFSTRSSVSEISGRGVGLDVVRSNVERIKGTIQVESTPHQGCLFRLLLNTSLSTTYVLLVQVNQTVYALPVESVKTMLRISPEEIFAIEGTQTITFAGESISVVHLADLLGLPVQAPTSAEGWQAGPKVFPCIILQLGSEYLALRVDTLLEQQDIVLKPQSKLLKRVRNITGATILGSGEVCMVLSPPDLFKSAKKGTLPIRLEELANFIPAKRKILLCDDSIPIRTQLRRILEADGYDVTVAVDGQDGFNKLRIGHFDAVVSDVQMPNLDGLGLTTQIRQFNEYSELPIILVTTLASEEDKRRGADVGANAYITKGDFDQRVLLTTLKRLI